MRQALPARPGPAGWTILPASVLGLLLALSFVGLASAATSWLDQPPRTWNQANSAVPVAPPLGPSVQPRCRTQERAASGPEEALVAAAGWRLETYWPTLRSGNVAIVMALSSYDGMCRPLGFNAFVFAGGQFSGTLSPVNLNSRTDGVFQDRPAFLSDGRIVATFLRYAPSDPLCCPSRPATQVIYSVDQSATGPVVDPDLIGTAVVPGQAPAARLPKSGEPREPIGLGLLLGGALIGLGFAIRDRARKGSGGLLC